MDVNCRAVRAIRSQYHHPSLLSLLLGGAGRQQSRGFITAGAPWSGGEGQPRTASLWPRLFTWGDLCSDEAQAARLRHT